MNPQTELTAEEARAAITATLERHGIDYRATLMQRDHNKDGWKCDAWRVVFSKPGETFALDYYTGTGRRTPAPRPRDGANRPRPRPGTLMHEELEAMRKPVPPSPADVLCSVVMDDTRGEDFEDWAADYGFDTDSRKALATYEQCQQQTRRARLFFGRDVLAQIADALSDY